MHSLDEGINNFIRELPEIDMNGHIYIWGTGNTASLYQEGFKREENLCIYGYADNKSDTWGKLFEGKRVYSPTEVEEDELACVLICSPQPSVIESVSKQLKKMNVPYYHVDAVIWGMNKDKIQKLFDMLYDEESKQVLLEVMRSRVEGRFPEMNIVSPNPYAPRYEFCDLNKNEVIVDCGAFVGDTMERMIWQRFGVFKKIIMIEPDAHNLKALGHRIDRLKNEWNLNDDSLKVLPYAVSDKSARAVVDNQNSNSNLGARIGEECADVEDGICVEVVALDDVLDETVTYLKADIESFEYKMLCGAKRIIKEYKPKLGICIYHNAVDFYSIPLLVKQMNPEYHIIIRHYTMQLFDTVMYAW